MRIQKNGTCLSTDPFALGGKNQLLLTTGLSFRKASQRTYLLGTGKINPRHCFRIDRQWYIVKAPYNYSVMPQKRI